MSYTERHSHRIEDCFLLLVTEKIMLSTANINLIKQTILTIKLSYIFTRTHALLNLTNGH